MKITKNLYNRITSGKEWGGFTRTFKLKVFSFVELVIVRREYKSKFSGYVEIPNKTLTSKLNERYYLKVYNYLKDLGVVKRSPYMVGEYCYSYKIDDLLLTDSTFLELDLCKDSLVSRGQWKNFSVLVTDSLVGLEKEDEKVVINTCNYKKPLVELEWDMVNLYNFDYGLFGKRDFSPINSGIYKTFHNSIIKEEISKQSKCLLESYDSIIAKKIEEINNTDYITNEGIKKQTIEVENSKPYSTKCHIGIAKEKGKIVVEDRNKYYYSRSVVSYRMEKIARMSTSWSHCKNNIISGKLYARRNSTNYRFDTNYTQMPNELFKSIVKENDLVELDIKNSQFAILANCMYHQGVKGLDFINFYKAATGGYLYELIAEALGITRSEAKLVMMEILFQGGTAKKGANQKMFAKKFPSVLEYVIKFKKDAKAEGKAKNSFPVYLQQVESHIMIDLVYKTLSEMGYSFIPKHDAVYVSRTQKEEIEDVILDLFEGIGFNCQLNGSTKPNRLKINFDDQVKKGMFTGLRQEIGERKLSPMDTIYSGFGVENDAVLSGYDIICKESIEEYVENKRSMTDRKIGTGHLSSVFEEGSDSNGD